MNSSKYLTAADVAEELGVSMRTAYEVIHRAGPQPIGRLLKVTRENLDRWLAEERARRAGPALPSKPAAPHAPVIRPTMPRKRRPASEE